MAESTIKDFVKKQTASLNIGVPKQRPAEEPERRIEPQQRPAAGQPEQQAHAPQVVTTAAAPRPVGRPRGDVAKVKMSLYVPEETKARLIKIQHMNYKSSLNDMLMEAIEDVLRKYNE